MDIIIELLTDCKHWVGWVLTTSAIIVVFHFLGVALYNPLWQIAVLLGVEVVVDVFKHLVELQ